jgi:putative MFS transporter
MYGLLVVAARFGPETFGKPLEAVTEKPAVLATAA